MIGDWVLLNGEPKQVQELLYDSITFDCFPHDYDDVAPIPLTHEILEKNGFENYKNSGILEYYKRDDVKFEKHQGIIWTPKNQITGIEYVHELQHALKLCGIEKDIIL